MIRTIWLAPTIAKCIASACKYPGACATRDVPYQQGRPVTDHSLTPGLYISAACSAPNWLKRIDPANAVKPADKPVAREWIGGRL
jgi:hypothetical protein